MNALTGESQYGLVQIVGDQITTTSLKIAEVFERRHDNVIRTIKKLEQADESQKFARLNFEECKIKDLTGETTSHYNITRNGFSMLVMGFTGAKAFVWKEKFLEAFDMMAEKLKRPVAPAIPQTLPEALRLAADEAEKRIEVEAALAIAQPKAAALDRIGASEGSMNIQTAAKTLKIRKINSIFPYLQRKGWIFRRLPNTNWIAYQDKIKAGYLEHKEHKYKDSNGDDRIKSYPVVTPKGLVKIAEMLEKDPI